MTVDTLIKIAKELGVPVAFAAVLCAGIWFTASWSASHIVDPLVKSHTTFLEAEQKAMPKIADSVDRQAVELKRMADESGQQTEYLRQLMLDQKKFPAVAEAKP